MGFHSPEIFAKFFQYVKDHSGELDNQEVQQEIMKSLSKTNDLLLSLLSKGPEELWSELWELICSSSSLVKKVLKNESILQIADPLDQTSLIELLYTSVMDKLADDDELQSLIWKLFEKCTEPFSVALFIRKTFSDDEILDMLVQRADDVRRNIRKDDPIYYEHELWADNVHGDCKWLLQLPGVSDNQVLMNVLAGIQIDQIYDTHNGGVSSEWHTVFKDMCDMFPIISHLLTSPMDPKPLAAGQNHRAANEWWYLGRKAAINYLETLFNKGGWNLVYLALFAEWYHISTFKYYGRLEIDTLQKETDRAYARAKQDHGFQFIHPYDRISDLNLAKSEKSEYEESRLYFFQLLGVQYNPIYDIERYTKFFENVFGNVKEPTDAADGIRQIQNILKDTFGHIELIEDSLI